MERDLAWCCWIRGSSRAVGTHQSSVPSLALFLPIIPGPAPGGGEKSAEIDPLKDFLNKMHIKRNLATQRCLLEHLTRGQNDG